MTQDIQWRHLQAALDRLITRFIERYKANLTGDNKTASGTLIESIHPVLEYTSGKYDVSISLADYWKYVEYGRRPGKFPPPNAILNWIRIKPVLPRPINGITPTEKQLTFLIGRKIATEGIAPGHQMQHAFDEVLASCNEELSSAIAQDIAEELSF